MRMQRATRVEQSCALRLRLLGYSFDDIGRHMGCDHQRVRRMVQRREREVRITSELNAGLIDTRLVPLWTKDMEVRAVATVDVSDFGMTEQHRWHVHANKYASHWEYEPKSLTLIHRAIMNPPADLVVDHIDGDGLNNRRDNLRVITSGQNSQNQRVQRGNTSGIRGVRWNSRAGKWMVRLELSFDSKEQAAQANRELRATYMPYSKEAIDAGLR